jgi:membrane associated rhomboid family serine protease
MNWNLSNNSEIFHDEAYMNNNFRALGLYMPHFVGVFIALLSFVAPAHAYVGPGMDFGTLGAAFGMLMTGVSAVFYLSTLWLRRLWRRVTRMVVTAERTADPGTMRCDP